MPELPEVETIKRGLRRQIRGRKVVGFEKRDEKVVQFEPKEIKGLRVIDISRRAKILIFQLSKDKSILVHLKMTGQLIWEKCPGEKEHCLRNRISGGHPNKEMIDKLPTKSTRAIFYFDDNSALYFNDQRRFGWIKIYNTGDIFDAINKVPTEQSLSGSRSEYIGKLKNLGVEPFSKDFSVEYLAKQARRFPERKIKQFLTDQNIVAGVGNIYSNEGLFYAGIKPSRRVKSMKKYEWSKIFNGVLKALNLGLKYGGSSDNTYVNAEGKQGEVQKHLMVYRRNGKKCKKCSGIIKRVVVGGRGTFHCPKCQS